MLDELDLKVGEKTEKIGQPTQQITKFTGSCRTSTGPYLCC